MPKKSMVILTESMFYVLMALSQGQKCGTQISSYITKKTQSRVPIGPGTLYTILDKFENEKYIEELYVQGRMRTYAITKKGLEAYNREVDRLCACIKDANNPTLMEEV